MAGNPRKHLKKCYQTQSKEEFDALCARHIKQGNKYAVEEVLAWIERGCDNPRKTTPSGVTYENTVDMHNDVDIPYEEQLVLNKIQLSKNKLKQKARAPGISRQELETIYALLKKLDNERLQIIFKYDFKAFDDYFFQDLQDRVNSPQFHDDMFKLYMRSKRCCVVCPRSHGKTTVARKFILHQILHQLVTYVILVGASEDMSSENLRWIRDQLIENKRIMEVYGYLKDPNKWSDTTFNTATGIRVKAVGANQKVRGRNEKGRPDLVYIDDLEEDEGVLNKDQRDKLKEWFKKALMPMRSRYGRLIITGTILHVDSLLKNVMTNKIRDRIPWDVLFYQAINTQPDGTEYALWAEMYPLEDLKADREADPQTFAQEKQNDPRAGSMAVFEEKEYQYLDDLSMEIKVEPGFHSTKRVYLYEPTTTGRRKMKLNIQLNTDHAISERTGADYTVLMITGMDRQGRLFVVEYSRFRTSDTKEIIDETFRLLMKYGGETMTAEDRLIQKVLKKPILREMNQRKYFFQIKEIPRSNSIKLLRIKALKAPIRTGLVYWYRYMRDLEEELSQVTATSLGIHDDIIDALADGYQCQFEERPEEDVNPVEINSYEWLIQEGLLPTVMEEEEDD